MNIFYILLSVGIISHVVRTVYEVLKIKGRVNPENKLVFAVMFIFMVVLWASWFGMCDLDPVKMNLPPLVKYCGLAAVIIGVLLFTGSLVQTRSLEDYTGDLITGGIYAFIRHPMYLGNILWLFGYPLYADGLVSLCLAPVFSLNVLVWRRLEEIQLHKRFPGYGDYKMKTLF